MLLILFLALTQLYICQRLATAGKVVAELEVKAGQISAKNGEIKEQIVETGSLSYIYEKAQELGFKSVDRIVYLTSEVPVALNQ